MAQLSRPKRWAEAVAKGQQAQEALNEALQELEELRGEYEEWLNNLPDALQSSAVADKLNEIVNMDFNEEISVSVLDEAESADLPQGFGRD